MPVNVISQVSVTKSWLLVARLPCNCENTDDNCEQKNICPHAIKISKNYSSLFPNIQGIPIYHVQIEPSFKTKSLYNHVI